MLKIISGGQTGIDRAALELAKSYGLPTGGFAPKFFLTERGPDPTLATFGLVETSSREYPPRTRMNVQCSEATLWIGPGDSRGYVCTKTACEMYKKPFWEGLTGLTLATRLETNFIKVLNVAGPRGSRCPDAERLVREVLGPTFELLRGQMPRQNAKISMGKNITPVDSDTSSDV